MASIRITETPPGEVPLEIRKAWVGVELPLARGVSRPVRVPIQGVLSGAKGVLGLIGNTFRLRRKVTYGYVVKAATAIESLEKTNPPVASWWRTNAPHAIRPWKLFVFPAACCELVAQNPVATGSVQGNPYAAPRAHVADASQMLAETETPDQVAWATLLLWITFGLGVINSAISWQALTATAPIEFVIAVQAGTFAFLALLVINISLGHNWARITYLVLMVIGLPMVVLQLPASFAQAPASAVVGAIQALLQVIALYLIFGPGRRWYRS